MSSRSKWDISNPRLWYRDDLVNHPELIPLEGQTIDISKIGKINKKIFTLSPKNEKA